MEPDDDVGGRGAVPQHAHQAHRRQEDHGDRRLHRLLPPRHRARPPRERHDLGHGHQPRELRARPALHREGRRRPQDRLPRGPRAPRPRRPHRRREEPRHLRLRLRGRRQGQLPQLPRAAAQAGEAGRPHRLRQHAVERLRRAPRRRPHAQVHPLLPRLRARPQQGARRRRARRDLPAPRRRRRHPLPPRQVSVAPDTVPPHRRVAAPPPVSNHRRRRAALIIHRLFGSFFLGPVIYIFLEIVTISCINVETIILISLYDEDPIQRSCLMLRSILVALATGFELLMNSTMLKFSNRNLAKVPRFRVQTMPKVGNFGRIEAAKFGAFCIHPGLWTPFLFGTSLLE